MIFSRNAGFVVLQCLIGSSLAVSAFAVMGIAVTPADVTETARAVGGLSAQELLALTCLCSLILSFYLVRTLIVMAKKPCIYAEKDRK